MPTATNHPLPILNSIKQMPDWKRSLKNAVTSPQELIKILGLSHKLTNNIIENSDFRCLVTHEFIKKIKPNDINDPLLKQVLPISEENKLEGKVDPVGDLASMTNNGLLHKYHGRALLITTGACAIHCRYCFRRHYPYTDASCKPSEINKIMDYLSSNPDIEEIILSGGDPLVLDDEKLTLLFNQLEKIPSLTSLRIHTRLPIVLPSRITEDLLLLLRNSRFRITVVIHANHANELSSDEQKALKKLHMVGATLLNQSVLLKGINDDISALVQLSKRLHECHTLPYYLHLLDPVLGAMHFDVEENHAVKLIEELRSQVPGYLIPQLVREIKGNHSKTAIFSI